MGTVISDVNGAVCVLLSIACAWAVMDPKIKDGVVVKLGLITAALGFLACSLGAFQRNWTAMEAGQLLIHCGGAVVASGLVHRLSRFRARLSPKAWAGDEYV